MGTKERQQRDRDRIQQAILTAARDLFVTDGYRNVSMRKIADRIKIQSRGHLQLLPQ